MEKKKIITIVARKEQVTQCIKDDLRLVFGDKIQYKCTIYDNINEDNVIDGDIVLVSHHNRTQEIRAYIKPSVKILMVQRTFWERDISPLLKIPQGSRALVVSDSHMNTLQASNSLNNLNLENVTLIPYSGQNDDPGIKIAITPGEPECVPLYIQKIIDIGNRHLAIDTFLDIIYCLHLFDAETLDALVNYCSRTINDSMGVKAQYRDTVVENLQLHRTLEHINQGIIISSLDGTIMFSNHHMKVLMGDQIRDRKSTLAQIFGSGLAEQLLASVDTLTININAREIIVEHEVDEYAGETQNIYYFSDVTYIHSLENSIKNKSQRSGFTAKITFDDMIHQSETMSKCINRSRVFATSEKTILIQGESGTGKEMFAQSIHNASNRRSFPFVAINCAALPGNLLESELFGYEKGAFTGANPNGKPGLFEQAHNGTIFLDEIGDMPIELQIKLLRVLQERQLIRLGGNRLISVDVRVIAATNRDLEQEMRDGRFRADLYYRLNVLPILIEPLRNRTEDIIPLFLHFSHESSVPLEIEHVLVSYAWPGNVRELQNAAEYYSMMKSTDEPLPDFVYRENTIKPVPDIQGRILQILTVNSGIGRQRLRAILSSDYQMSEYSLRKTLEDMQKRGLIEIRTGRGGIVPLV